MSAELEEVFGAPAVLPPREVVIQRTFSTADLDADQALHSHYFTSTHIGFDWKAASCIMAWHGAFLIWVLSMLDESSLSSAAAFDDNVGKGFGVWPANRTPPPR
jgi:hypothetical protein